MVTNAVQGKILSTYHCVLHGQSKHISHFILLTR